MEFGMMLKIRRVTLGMTQQEVADKIGVNLMTYSRWERGHNKPMRALESKLKEVLKIDELIIEEESDAEKFIN